MTACDPASPQEAGVPRASARRRFSLGFTLVEIVIAIGVLSFALIPMIGLISGSLKSYKKGINDTVARQILSQLAANAQQGTNFTTGISNSYYDYEGKLLASATDPQRIFTGAVTISTNASGLFGGSIYQVKITVTPLDTNDVMSTSIQICPQN